MFPQALLSQRSLILLLLIFEFVSIIDLQVRQYWQNSCIDAFDFCPICFQNQSCDENYQTYVENTTFESFNIGSFLAILLNRENVQPAIWMTHNKQQKPIIYKHKFSSVKRKLIQHEFCSIFGSKQLNCNALWQNNTQNPNISAVIVTNALKRIFVSGQSMDGISLCANATQTAHRFNETFNHFSSELLFWLYCLVNPEIVLLHTFQTVYALNAFIPSVFSTCGFVIVEQNSGTDLYQFYGRPFVDRIYLAKQLLEAAFAFSHGINGFRIYLTDATPDNIVVDEQTLQIAFVDLDTMIIADSQAVTNSNAVHCHEQIDCGDGCFAYSSNAICSHYLSDVNLYAVCQIFTQSDSNGWNSGLLHSIEETLDRNASLVLTKLLDECVNCDKMKHCENRFDAAKRIHEFSKTFVVNK